MEALDYLEREGKKRRQPSLTNPNWLVLKQRREIFRKWLNGLPGEGLSVLDVGGRVQPYRMLLGERISGYWAIDIRQSPLVNVVARGEALPFKAGCFDLVICSQVIEYIPEPKALILELHRVLKPEGHLLMSAPAVFPRDSDDDLWRFMPQSLRLLLCEFRSVQVVAEGSSVSGFFRMLALFSTMFARSRFLRKFVSLSLVPAFNIMGLVLERILLTENDQFSANYSALARK